MLERRVLELESLAFTEAGEEFNLSSPQDVSLRGCVHVQWQPGQMQHGPWCKGQRVLCARMSVNDVGFQMCSALVKALWHATSPGSPWDSAPPWDCAGLPHPV